MSEHPPIKILIAKTGLDGHDRGAIVLTKALREQGFDTRYTGLRCPPETIAALAVSWQADCIGLSSLSGAHLTWFPQVTAALQAAGWQGSLVIAGGIIPAADEEPLRQAGIDAVFHPHQTIEEIAAYIRNACRPGTKGFAGEKNKVV